MRKRDPSFPKHIITRDQVCQDAVVIQTYRRIIASSFRKVDLTS